MDYTGQDSLGDLPNPGFKPRSQALQADYLLAEPQEKHNWNLNTIQMEIW